MLRSESGVKPKKTKKKYVENLKEKFRKSQEWKEFRSHMAILFNHRDYITGRKLVKGYNVHHLKTDQEIENYCDISDESNFIPLNSYCHKLLHYLFIYYKRDKTVLTRLQEILDKMCSLSQEDDVNSSIDPIDQEDMESCIDELEKMDAPSSETSNLLEKNEQLENQDLGMATTSPDSSMGSLGNETVSYS